MTYRAPVRDQAFILGEVLKLDGYSNLPGFADASVETVEQILEEGAKFAEGVLAPDIISLTAMPTTLGNPCPPNSASPVKAAQPPSTIWV